VLVYCTEVPEVHELADRVVVVDRGRPVRELRIADMADLTTLADAIATLEHTAVEAAPGAHAVLPASTGPAGSAP
jgi:hypothetical protein